MNGKKPTLPDRLERFKKGEVFDWEATEISGADLGEAIRAAFQSDMRVGILTLQNALVKGSVFLDTIGSDGRLPSFQAIGCRFSGGFRSGHAEWRQLSFLKSEIAFIQLPYTRFSRDLSICETRCHGSCLLVGIDVAGGVTLVKSEFAGKQESYSLNISEANVGRNIDARGIKAKGVLLACQVSVNKDLNLDGSCLSKSGGNDPRALDLSEAKIAEQLRMSSVGKDRFTCRGMMIIESAELGSISIKAANLDGDDKPAIIANQIKVRRSVDIGGLRHENGESFQCKGAIKFANAEIRHQFQFVDCDISSSEPALILQGVKVGGDLLIGHQTCSQTVISGGVSLIGASVGGGVRINNTNLSAEETALGLRQANVGGGIEVYDIKAAGALRFDDTRSTALDIIGATITRAVPSYAGSPPAETFAAPEDNLLDFSFVDVASNILIQQVNLVGGDCRFTGARVSGGVQISAINIAGSWLGLGAQNCRIGGGFMVAGSKASPSSISGQVAMMGAEIGGDITFVDMAVGTSGHASAVVLREVTAKAGVTFVRCTIYGQLNASSCEIGGDFHVHSSNLIAPGVVAFDARGARVNGKLQWASVGDGDQIDCCVAGWLVADGADVGALSWHRLRLENESALILTNMRVARSIEAYSLEVAGIASIDVAGTEAAILDDHLGDSDGWGDATTNLSLEGFNYQQLKFPAGGFEETADSIRRARRGWLNRRSDPRPTRAPRHLATVLRDNGLFDASRLVLMDAFRAEGRARQSSIGRVASMLFGITFGYGLSGRRAFLTLIGFWLVGTALTIQLSEQGLLVSTSEPAQAPCTLVSDPSLYAADLMLPIVDLGHESLCQTRPANVRAGAGRIFLFGGEYRLFGAEAVASFGLALYKMLGWALVSLAIATWSGLFRRSGRE